MIEENRNFESKPRDFLKKQGFYVVLFICLLIVGTAIVLTALPRESAQAPNAQQTAQQPVVVETRKSDDETLKAKNSPLPTATPFATPLPTATPKPASSTKSIKKGAAPVKGEIIWAYASDQLLYSRTLNQWTTHAGLDLAAEVGSDVTASLAGTIEKIYEDDALGQVVTIAHTNGRTSLYANLEPTVSVKQGQKVNAGDVIGKIGTSSISECADLPHLHFGFLVDGKTVNPTDYVTIPH
ncbi:MAG: peptidoglycan DD-metalloendopeptidase family protein [Clostridia bacterium]